MTQKFNVRRTSRPQIYAATVTRLAAMIARPNPSPAVFIALMLVGPRKFLKQIVQIKLNRVKNPNWREANQLAIYKHGRGFELGTTVNKPS